LDGFSGPFGLKWGFVGQNRGRCGATPNEFFLPLEIRPWEWTDGQTHRQTDRRKPIL